MGLFDAIRGQFIDVIEWLDDTNDTMAYRFERHGNEIKNGARLIVRPGQDAVFVSEGQVADEFPAGTYTLETKNLPILSTLQAWKYGFNSPFKAEVYFFNLKQFTGLKWGTSNPVILRDRELGPVRMRAYGSYSLRIAHPATLLRQLISTDGRFETGEITDQLRALLTQSFAGWLGKSDLSVFDFAAHYAEIGENVRVALQPDFAQYGLELVHVVIENIGLPAEVEQAIDRRTSMGVVGDLGRYTQFQAAEAIREGAGAGGNPAMDLAVGLAMGQQVSDALRGGAAGGATPPPLPGGGAEWHIGIGGAQSGPFTADTVLARIADGSVTRETLVWKAGMSAWAAAGGVEPFASRFGSVPPPLPNAS
ncbi:MAG: SPFH domain-containing protein [Armatimonadota bacterium]